MRVDGGGTQRLHPRGGARLDDAGLVGLQVRKQPIGHGGAQAGDQVVAGGGVVAAVAAARDDVVVALRQVVEGLLGFVQGRGC